MPSLAFIEGPLLDFAADLVPGIIQGLEEAGIGAKCAPLGALSKIFGKPKADPDTTDEQKKQDGKNVIKVSDAIKIVKDSLDGLGGTTSELLDVIRGAMPVAGKTVTDVAPNISHTIAVKLRKAALSQKNPELRSKAPHRTRRGSR